MADEPEVLEQEQQQEEEIETQDVPVENEPDAPDIGKEAIAVFAGEELEADKEPAPVETNDDVPGLNQALVEKAKTVYGLEDDLLEGMDDARLEKLFTTIDRRLMQPQQTQTQPQPDPTPKPEASSMPTEFVPLKIEMPEDIDEAFHPVFNNLVEQFNQRLGEEHNFRQQVMGKFQMDEVNEEVREFDKYLKELGPEWEDVYGTGETRSMDPESPHFKKRLEVLAGYRRLSQDATLKSLKLKKSDLYQRSHAGVNYDRISEIAVKKVNGQVDKRKKQFGERPTTTGSKKKETLSLDEQAIAALTG